MILLSKRVTGPVVIIIMALLLVFILVSTKKTTEIQTNVTKAWPVHTEKVIIRSIAPRIKLFGKVESPRATKIEAEVTGTVEHVYVRDGDKVKVGQLLVKLDDEDKKLDLAKHIAREKEVNSLLITEKKKYISDQKSLEIEKQLYSLKQDALAREKHLADRQLAAKSRLDEAMADLHQMSLQLNQRELNLTIYQHRETQLEAQLENIKAEISQAKLDLSRTNIVAPFAGRITDVSVAKGNRVTSGELLVEMFDTNDIEVKTEIPENYLIYFRQNTTKIKATAIVDQQKIKLQFARLSGKVSIGKTGITGFFTVTDGGAFLHLNRAIEFIVTLPKLTDVIGIPPGALYNDNILYLIENDKLQAVQVKIVGHIIFDDNTSNVIITSNKLKSGDEILITHLPNARTGLPVKKVEENNG